MEPEDHPIEKKNYLPNGFLWFHVNFQLSKSSNGEPKGFKKKILQTHSESASKKLKKKTPFLRSKC